MKDYKIALHVWGEYACFTRPEMKVERVSYDVITPSAARGVLEAVYWKPQIRWLVERIHVLKPIRLMNVRRNEVASKIPTNGLQKIMKEGHGRLGMYVDEDRQQRASIVLRNVGYVIEARFEIFDPKEHPEKYKKDPKEHKEYPKKHYEMFKRRAEKGQHFHQPYLGTREFACHYEWLDHDAIPRCPESLIGEKDLGYMLHDIDFKDNNTPHFFRAEMKDGIINVPDFETSEVKA